MAQAEAEQPHDFSSTVIAVFPTEGAGLAVAELESAQFQVEVLTGEEGRAHLDTEPGGGLIAGLRKMARSFGDETRIVGALDAAMEEGKTVISVEADDDRAPEAARILEGHGGSYLWRFGEWSFNRVGDTDDDVEVEQAPEAARGTVDEKAKE
jgi:hypothetical protein